MNPIWINSAKPFLQKIKIRFEKNTIALAPKIFNTQKIPKPSLSFTLNFK